MRKLLKVDVPFEWSDECQKELNYMKECLLSQPILQPLDPSKEVIIQTDASYAGFGFVILQRNDEGKLQVVYYGGSVLTDSQGRYCAADLELSSLVLALKSVEWFAIHKQVIVFTDNSRVLYCHKWAPLNARQRRMIVQVVLTDCLLVIVYCYCYYFWFLFNWPNFADLVRVRLRGEPYKDCAVQHVLHVGYPFCSPANSVKAFKEVSVNLL